MASDSEAAAKLDELLDAIQGYDDVRRASAEWKQVFRVVQGLGVPSARVAGIVGMRDADQLAALIAELRSDADAPPPEEETPDAETCRRALKAFRKRVKFTRLDEESKLGRSPLTKGAGHSAAAIEPPVEWPEPVWRELVRQGKLRYIGRGFYELV